MPSILKNLFWKNWKHLSPCPLPCQEWDFLVPQWVPKTTALQIFSSLRRTPPPPGSPTSRAAATTHQHKAQIAAQLLGEGPVHLSGIEKFWSQFEDFLVHKALAGNVVSIKWDVNFHEYFPHGCSLWSLSNLAITMWSIGHTAWVKFKKLAASQWGEGQSSNSCVFSLSSFLSYVLSLSLAHSLSSSLFYPPQGMASSLLNF